MTADVALAAAPQVRARRLPKLPLTVALSAGWMAAMVLVAIFAHWLKPYTITGMDLMARLQPPVFMGGSWDHVLGTDQLGRDVLARLIVSIRVSLTLAVSATVLGVLFGGLMGLAAAHFRGPVEQLVLILIDVQAALPFIILALSALAFFGNSWLLLVFLLAFYGWERHARVVRGLALAASRQGYMQAVEQLGAGPGRLYLRHMLPNMAATLVVSATLAFPEVILAASGLSFLGLGIQPPNTSLGNMVGYGRAYLQNAPWVLLAPSAVIVLTTLSISMLGDWMRDRLDPAERA
ncbi:ABC transporter permease [Poseidonocella sp. HB161398]|uniref:ABC transporter permease n=1 Tax=Poseidonocella sp. HB161398 TaxID=2320855 RepID=UPI00110973EE|nr:ABC transporter permease [Poseidonocella sp. HB161398]